MPVRQGADRPALLTVAVQLERLHRRAQVVTYLASQPLLPRWRVQAIEGPGDSSAGAARVAVVGSLALQAAQRPAPRARTGMVAMLDDPSELASWSGIGCVLLTTEPMDRLGRAIAEAAEGNVWLSPQVAPHLPHTIVTARVAGPALVSERPESPPEAELTPAEEETLALVVRGLSNAEIAARRGVKVTTVKTCVRSVLRKHGCQRRQELIAVALGRYGGER